MVLAESEEGIGVKKGRLPVRDLDINGVDGGEGEQVGLEIHTSI